MRFKNWPPNNMPKFDMTKNASQFAIIYKQNSWEHPLGQGPFYMARHTIKK